MVVLQSLFWFVIALGLLVAFHEFGHYWVARRLGVRVLRFSIGFGPALWRRQTRDGVEFVIAAVPLGGYVKMLDEREGPVDATDRHQAYNRQPIPVRAAIVIAGPVFNLLFAVLVFWLMYMVGVPETRPVVGETSALAADAGLQSGDLIVAVDGRSVQTWTHVLLALMPAALDRRNVELDVERSSGERDRLELPLSRLGDDLVEDRMLEQVGLQPWRPRLDPVIGEVEPDGPADLAGIRAGDRILEVNGHPVDDWSSLVGRIPREAHGGQPLELLIERDGRREMMTVWPEQRDGRWLIGVRPQAASEALQAEYRRAFTILRHGPFEALREGVTETWRLTSATLGMLGRMVTGSASLSNLSGPVTIAQLANQSAALGLSRFLFFLGLISLSLAIINLLPIPVLDGGHLLYLALEWLRGAPLPERAFAIGQMIGLMLILGLMALAISNDLTRLAQ